MPNFPDPRLAHVPACRFACPRLTDPVPGGPTVLVVRCSAPHDLKEACGYPASLCPHKGPYTDMDDAREERDSCLLRQALRLS